MHPILYSLPIKIANDINNVRMLGRTTPATSSVADKGEALLAAAKARVDQLSPGSNRNKIQVQPVIPTSFQDAARVLVVRSVALKGLGRHCGYGSEVHFQLLGCA